VLFRSAWADVYLLPGRTDVMLVQGRYPVVPVVPVVPTRGGDVPEGTFWVYDVAFTFPEHSERVMARLADAAGRLEAAAPSELTHETAEWGVEHLEVSALSSLLRKGRVSVREGAVGVRSQERNGEFVAPDSVMPAVSNLLASVRESGYYIAGLSRPIEPPKDGVLTVHVDSGRVGDVTVAFQPAEGEEGEAAETGRWYSGDQIRRRFERSAPGLPFNYGALYNALSDANEVQDLSVDTDVKIRQEQGEDGSVSRVADVKLDVRETMPIHGTLEIGNDGSDQSGNWWVGGSLRHQNLTRHDDILSLEAQVALEDASLFAVSGSYLLPHSLWMGGTLGVYGGYSELNINDLVPDIGVSVMGKYVGLRFSQRLLETRLHRVELAIGQTFRWTTENLEFGGVGVDERDAMIAPYYAQLTWQQKQLDALDGRTFAMLEVSHNFKDWLGTSSDLDSMRVGADGDYTIGRGQLARLQALNKGKGDGLDSRWTLFARVTGQVSDESLVAMEQFGLGGASTVRGYAERELLLDSALFGSVEARTPVLRLFDDLHDRLQFVAFMDSGWGDVRKTQPGESSDRFLLSAGLGLRYAMWKNAMLRFDWGFPLEQTFGSDSTGRGHLNFQLQF
jgi:hemolysin activation/secretion protein